MNHIFENLKVTSHVEVLSSSSSEEEEIDLQNYKGI